MFSFRSLIPFRLPATPISPEFSNVNLPRGADFSPPRPGFVYGTNARQTSDKSREAFAKIAGR